MKISRPCYDKYHRCPQWAGGGIYGAKVNRCEDGSVIVPYGQRLWRWRFHRCNECNVLVLPYMIRRVDLQYAYAEIVLHIFNWRYRRSLTKEEE